MQRRRCLHERLKKVLIVDDSMVMRTMIKDILTKGGFEVVGQAKNGKEALEMYTQLHPDLVTMDIIMPGEHGTEIVKKIMATDAMAKIMVVSGLNQKNLSYRLWRMAQRSLWLSHSKKNSYLRLPTRR